MTTVLNGVEYDLAPGIESYTVTMDTERIEIRLSPALKRAVNVCEHCKRADWVEAVAHSWGEAIEWGWFVRRADGGL